jgi:hypothetical protein
VVRTRGHGARAAVGGSEGSYLRGDLNWCFFASDAWHDPTPATACAVAIPSLAAGSIRSEVAPDRRDHCRATR